MIRLREGRSLRTFALITAFAWFALPGQVHGQWLVANPKMDELSVGAIRPGLGRKYVTMTARQVQLVDEVLGKQFGPLAQLEAARELLSTEDLPYTIERWATMKRVLLATEAGLPDEVEQVAFDWLKRYPDSLAPVPAEYRYAFPHDPDINMNLRVYLAHMYLHLASDTFNWPEDHRYERVQELMAPLLEKKQYMSVEEVDARVWFASRCDNAAGMYMATVVKNLEKGKLDEGALQVYRRLSEAEAADQRARLYESVATALKNALANPVEYDRAVSCPIPEHMIAEKIQSVVATALDCRRVAEETKNPVLAALNNNDEQVSKEAARILEDWPTD